jgi:amino acid transporter lysE
VDLAIFKGIIMGLILSLPFGPVGIYCMELTIREGKWKGYITALGMVTIDVVYSGVALIFLTRVKDYIIKYENYLSLVIGIFLLIISVRKLMNKVEINEIKIDFKSMLQNYLTGLGFAIVNISSILIIASVFTVLRVLQPEIPLKKTVIETLIGVGTGGMSLWFLTCTLITHFKKLFSEEKVIKAIKIANIMIFVLALILIIISLKKLILCF